MTEIQRMQANSGLKIQKQAQTKKNIEETKNESIFNKKETTHSKDTTPSDNNNILDALQDAKHSMEGSYNTYDTSDFGHHRILEDSDPTPVPTAAVPVPSDTPIIPIDDLDSYSPSLDPDSTGKTPSTAPTEAPPTIAPGKRPSVETPDATDEPSVDKSAPPLTPADPSPSSTDSETIKSSMDNPIQNQSFFDKARQWFKDLFN